MKTWISDSAVTIAPCVRATHKGAQNGANLDIAPQETMAVTHSDSGVVDVSVIIVSYNTRALTLDCLRSVYAQTQDVTFEVFVVDNASTDGSAAAVAAEFPRVNLIVNAENRGFAAANNQALRIARGRYVLLLNSDTVVLDRAIERCVAFADTNPAIGVVGCRAEWPDGRFQSSYFRFPGLLSLTTGALFFDRALRGNRSSRVRYYGRVFSQPQDVDVVAGCFFLVRSQVIRQVGLLDEDFFMYGEEAEWCWRIHQAGWRVCYYPPARIIHYWGGGSGGAPVASLLAKRRGVLLVLRKTRGLFCAWCGNVVMMLGVLMRMPYWALQVVGGWVSGCQGRTLARTRLSIVGFHLRNLVPSSLP